MAVITFSRQFGSLGDEIAARVCDLLEYRYFDKRLLVEAAAHEGLTPEQIVDYHEDTYKMRGLMDRLRGYRPLPWQQAAPEYLPVGLAKEGNSQIGENMLVWLADAAVRAAYQQGNYVIVGRAGQAILMDKPLALHIRIEAPLDERIALVAERQSISLNAARLIVSERDRAGADYLRRFYGVNWSDPLLYHLVVNTGRWDLESAVDMIVCAAGHLVRTKEPEEKAIA